MLYVLSMPPSQQALGTSLLTLRTAAGLTIQEVSDLAGVAPSYLSRAENGLVSPSPAWVHNVATAIGERIANDTKAEAS